MVDAVEPPDRPALAVGIRQFQRSSLGHETELTDAAAVHREGVLGLLPGSVRQLVVSARDDLPFDRQPLLK